MSSSSPRSRSGRRSSRSSARRWNEKRSGRRAVARRGPRRFHPEWRVDPGGLARRGERAEARTRDRVPRLAGSATREVFVAAFQAAALIESLRATGAIAVGFNLPSTHRAFQLKGTDATVGSLDRGDLEIAVRYVEAFIADIALLGYSEPIGRALLAFDPAELLAISFTPSAAFVQTPGPRAGARVGR